MGKVIYGMSFVISLIVLLTVSFGLITIGMIIFIPAVIGINMLWNSLIWSLTTGREEGKNTIQKVKTYAKDRVEIWGDAGKGFSETAAIAAVKTAEVVSAGIKAGYKRVGGREGAKKAADEFAKGTKEFVAVGAYTLKKTGDAVIDGIKEARKQIQEDQARNKNTKQLKNASDQVSRIIGNFK